MTSPRPRTPRLETTPWPRALAYLLGAASLPVLGLMAVAAVRWLMSFGAVADLVAAYPGTSTLPEVTAPGIPAWVSWTHFLNAFFLVLIIRSGLRVRNEKVAGGLWSSRKVKKRRMSLALWGHIAVDVLWLVNGVVFVVLLFATGHWARIVPTSWDVFPHALSAFLQYASLDWPVHDGWTHYNALQQLSYFAIVFLAAPVAALTGFRLSAFWPRQNERLSRVFPEKLAKSLHWPTMLFFVAFVIVHVGLVLTTGLRRNLNTMYAGNDGDGWLGAVVFLGSLVILAAGWLAIRHDRWIAAVARRFGDVRLRK
ncbi:cytochrome b/b6 domain-containing protein [Microbacterium gilvum]|uniref:Cytochrome b561 bacterial/Ni-hydrogenase domain-containing protein n=1 Tax=Microbacterium gilvum TaxID=1336204 RepID=A0ABP9AN20_9MICO